MVTCNNIMSVLLKQRVVIELLTAEGESPIDMHRRIMVVYRDDCVDISMVRRLDVRACTENTAGTNLV